MNKKLFKAVMAAAFLLAASVSAPAWSAVIYSQPTDLNGGFASQNDTNGNGNFATTYDNFTLGAASNIAFVTWVGSYFNPSAQGTITAFTLDFWTDNSGQPGSLLDTFAISGTCNEASLGNDNFGDPTFSYGCAVNFNASAATAYWLSIVPDLGFPPQWAWETGTGGDGVAFQDFSGLPSSTIPVDLAFALYDAPPTATPEPFSFALMGAGLIGMSLLRR